MPEIILKIYTRNCILAVPIINVSSIICIPIFTGTVLVNNSDCTLDWSLDLTSCGKAIEEGIFRFIHADGSAFGTEGDNRKVIKESMMPGEAQELCVMFCPGMGIDLIVEVCRNFMVFYTVSDKN